jgi:zinc D-Ala-D-Ala carboxypeptidase
VPNIPKSPKYLLLAIAGAGLFILLKLLVFPTAAPITIRAIQHSPSIDTQIANLLPPITETTLAIAAPTPIQSVLAIKYSALSPAIQLPKPRSWKYRVAVPAHSSIAGKYNRVAQETGYLEEYPEISRAEMTEYQGQQLSKDAATAFDRMRQAAAQEGISLKIISGFRSISTQNNIFVGKGGGHQAAAYSAPPGHSQHHTGLAIDINSLSPNFRTTAAFQWLHRHGTTYGFMLPYANQEGDLGPRAEPWHWVYVAKLPAMQLMASFVDRARQNNYDPFLGNPQLAEIYHAATNLALQSLNKSKS